MNPTAVSYFIQKGTDGPIKIGKTKGRPLVRLAQLQTKSVERLRLLGCVRAKEKNLHLLFHRHLISGEWFEPHRDILRYVRTHSIPAPIGTNNDKMMGVRVSNSLYIDLLSEQQTIVDLSGIRPSLNKVVEMLLGIGLKTRRSRRR
jgi:hypothetical protein